MDRTKKLLREADAVFFDVDSTWMFLDRWSLQKGWRELRDAVVVSNMFFLFTPTWEMIQFD